MTIRKLVLLLTLLVQMGICKAQYSELSIGVGASSYWGDLNAIDLSANINQSKYAVEANYIYSINRLFNVRASVSFMKLTGDDTYAEALPKRQRNLNFATFLTEVGAQAEFHFFGFAYGQNDVLASPYLLLGINAFYFNPTTEYQGQRVELRPLGTEGQGLPGYDKQYSKVALAIPFGGGIKYKVNERLCIGLEGNLRYTFTDYLDDVSKVYVDYNEIRAVNGDLAANLSQRVDEYRGLEEGSLNANFVGIQRGSPDVKDYYLTAMLKMQIYLGTGARSPLAMFKKSKTYCPTF